MKTTIISLACLVAASTAAQAQATKKLSATKANDYGLIYSLPTTVLDITVEVEKIEKHPGQFYEYARKYLNENNPVTTNSVTWKLKNVHVNARGVINPKEQYLMTFRPGYTPYLLMDENDLPLAINTEDVESPEAPELPTPVAAEPTPLQTKAARQVVSEEMLRSVSNAKRAELAAAKIYELRQSRNDLITGQADQMPPDGKAMQIVMDELAAQEAALTAMFVGTEQHSTDVRTFTYTPGDEVSRHVLARISAIDGIVEADNLSGDPIYLSLEITQKGKLPKNEKGEPKTMPKDGVAYCIPGSATLKIDYRGRNFWDGTFDAAQYGVVFGLDPKMFSDKKEPSYVIFDPITGNIVELGSKQE